MSLLTIMWLYIDTKDTDRIATFSYSILWMTLLSLSFFIIFPYLLKKNLSFGFDIKEQILECFMYITVVGLGVTAAEKFGKK